MTDEKCQVLRQSKGALNMVSKASTKMLLTAETCTLWNSKAHGISFWCIWIFYYPNEYIWKSHFYFGLLQNFDPSSVHTVTPNFVITHFWVLKPRSLTKSLTQFCQHVSPKQLAGEVRISEWGVYIIRTQDGDHTGKVDLKLEELLVGQEEITDLLKFFVQEIYSLSLRTR